MFGVGFASAGAIGLGARLRMPMVGQPMEQKRLSASDFNSMRAQHFVLILKCGSPKRPRL